MNCNNIESRIEERIKEEAVNSTRFMPEEIVRLIKNASADSAGLEKKFLDLIIENISIASEKEIPVCQDTGVFEVWLEVGTKSNCFLNWNDIVQKAVIRAHCEGGLRASMLNEIQAVIHSEFTENNFTRITITPRGFGSENYSFLHMMPPSADMNEIKNQVMEDVKKAGCRPCPPFIIGIGIGGTASKAVELSVKALTDLSEMNETEKDLCDAVNMTGIGTAGVGGKYTALMVKIKEFPRHIAGTAVGVHIGCWANRVRSFTVEH